MRINPDYGFVFHAHTFRDQDADPPLVIGYSTVELKYRATFCRLQQKENPLPVKDSGFIWRYDYADSPWQPRYLIDLLIDLDRKLCALSFQIVCPSG